MNSFEIRFKKSFVGTSANGKLFHWLKSTFSPCKELEDLMITAVQLLYTPKFLASSPQSWGLVFGEVALSRDIFQSQMKLVPASPPANQPLPKRVKISFSRTFDPTSKSGKTFEWLLQTYQDKVADEIIGAVNLLYYPATLAANAATSNLAAMQVERSRRMFEEVMTEAILESKPTAIALIANRLDQSYVASSSEETMAASPAAQTSEIPILQPPSTKLPEVSQQIAADDFDDDFVDVDRTRDQD